MDLTYRVTKTFESKKHIVTLHDLHNGGPSKEYDADDENYGTDAGTTYWFDNLKFQTKISFPGAKELSLRFSRCTEVGTFTDNWKNLQSKLTNFQTKLTLSSKGLDSDVVFTQSRYHRQENEQDPPGTARNPAPFQLMADRCTLDYSCESLSWFVRDGSPFNVVTDKDIQWGWSCLVSATMDSPDISDSDLASIITLCPKLHPNKLVHFGKGPKFCKAVATHWSKIKDLDLSRCVGVTDKAVSAIAARCKQLQIVTLRHCVGVRGPGVKDLARNCPALTRVDLIRTSVKDEAVVCSLVAKCPNLHPDSVISPSKTRGKLFLETVTKHRPDISFINLQNMVGITLDDVRALINKCTELVEIDLSGCSQFSKLQLREIDTILQDRRL